MYLSYGIHRCLNFVTGSEGVGSAILVRSIIDERDFEPLSIRELISGPGRVGVALGVELSWSGLDLFSTKAPISLEIGVGGEEREIATSGRIGISKGTDIEWRLYDSRFPLRASRK